MPLCCSGVISLQILPSSSLKTVFADGSASLRYNINCLCGISWSLCAGQWSVTPVLKVIFKTDLNILSYLILFFSQNLSKIPFAQPPWSEFQGYLLVPSIGTLSSSLLNNM